MRAWPGGLAIARSIGDVDCGDFVSPQPDVRTVPAPASGFVILGSDGVWDALSLTSVGRAVKKSTDAQDLAKRLVRKAVQAQPISRRDHAEIGSRPPRSADPRSIRCTQARGGLCDDTTCLALQLGDASHFLLGPPARASSDSHARSLVSRMSHFKFGPRISGGQSSPSNSGEGFAENSARGGIQTDRHAASRSCLPTSARSRPDPAGTVSPVSTASSSSPALSPAAPPRRSPMPSGPSPAKLQGPAASPTTSKFRFTSEPLRSSDGSDGADNSGADGGSSPSQGGEKNERQRSLFNNVGDSLFGGGGSQAPRTIIKVASREFV